MVVVSQLYSVVASLAFLWALILVLPVTEKRKISLNFPRVRAVKKEARRTELDLGMLLTEVATRLECGASIERAWSASLQSSGLVSAADSSAVLTDDGVPKVFLELWELGWWKRIRRNIPRSLIDGLPNAVAVCRLGHSSGAPMAEVLEECAQGVSEAIQAQSARKVALAAPMASVKMLAWLPLIGVFFAYLMNVDPLRFLFETNFGRVSFVLALCFEICGLVIVKRLITKAKQEE